MADSWEMDNLMLDAKEVYVVMQNNYRISRNIRAQWFFRNLNKILTFKWKTCQRECTEEIEVISAIPKNMEHFKVDSETNSSCIKIVPDTKVHFLSTQYRLVFCLDMSSSVASIDIQHDSLCFEEIYSALEQSLKSLSEPFFVPGSRYFFIPQIFITVIAHIPNCATAAPQVLIQGWILIPENVNTLLASLKEKIIEMCQLVKKVSSSVQEQQIQFMMPHDDSGAVTDGTIDGNKMIKKVLDLSADISTLNIIRYGILALQLLPENSSAGVIVITDGVLSFPNCKSLDALLSQLRNSTIACSFIQLGSPFHPFSSFGRVPYKELMEFISTATCGAYFPACRDIILDPSRVNQMNAYHKSLLFWNFQKTATSYFLEAYEPSPKKDDYWKIENPHFYTVAHQSRVRKKHTEGTLKVSLENLLSCRLREGYSVKSVIIDDVKNSTEVTLVLPWMLSTNIEYIITSAPARKSTPDIPSCHFEVIVDGCYEFLHDVTCSDKKPIKSLYRKTVIAQFWNYIKNLSNTDQILMQLHSFAHNPVYYTIPDNIKNGVPLFYFPNNSSMPVLSSRNVANMQFTSFWKPLCMLDINVWQKWMHAHRIGIILHHDIPLPKNLHLPNSSGRYVHVQCRQATAALNSLLSEHSSFTLVENHSYIKLLFDDPDKPPYSFYVIRVTSKPPCVVLRLAFLGGLPGHQRYEIVNDLRQKILSLKRSTAKDSQSSKQLSSIPPESCCFLLKKPVEKILIRYEKLPINFLISIPENQYNDDRSGSYSKHSDSHLYTDALITLSKYLQQQRWVWTLQYESNTSLDLPSASKILYTLTNIRLDEGFRFAHSGSGIMYMVQEFPVLVHRGDASVKPSEADTNCCVVQYILFPPHTNTTLKDNTSEDDDIELTEADGELQLITECWVEPQLGDTIVSPRHSHLQGLKFSEISNALHKKDLEVITVLTTFEHLCIICEKTKSAKKLLPPQPTDECQIHVLNSSPSIISPQANIRPTQENISVIPYCFNLLSLLPKCSQTEITLSAVHTDIPGNIEGGNVNGNEILFNFFIDNLKSFHHHEILFTLEDSYIFPFLVHHRDRDLQEHPVPFPHPVVKTDLSTINQELLFENYKSCSLIDCPFSGISDCPHKLLESQSDLKDHQIAKWRCFVKGCSPYLVILTIVPASFDDLKKLCLQNVSLLENHPEMQGVDVSVNEINESEKPEDETFPKETDEVETDMIVNNAPVQENVDNKNLNSELLYVPLYVYNGLSSSIINQMVSSNQWEKTHDSFMKFIFEYENCIDVQSNISSARVITPSQLNEQSEIQIKRSKKDAHYFHLKDHCSLIEKSHAKAFVYCVYKSLLQDAPVHKLDAIAAIDEICEESLREVDITEFVSMICGHVKDFTTKHSVWQMHHANDDVDKTDQRKEEDKGEISNSEKTGKFLFPLSLLQKHHPCEHLQQKHMDIKEKFMDIIKSFFKPIPSRPDYFYFNHVEEDEEEASLKVVDEEESHKDDSLQDESLIEFGDECAATEVDKASNILEDETSAKSLNTDSLSSFDKDTEPTFSDKSLYPPLFVHFSCSVRKNKQEIKSCPLSSLPTCLNDIISCLDPECDEIDLEDLRITLDITCLTVPSDIKNPNVERHRVYSTSFSSSSPIPEADFYRKRQITDENESDTSEAPSDTIQGETLQNLSPYQQSAVLKCIEKIKWLLQDEKASVALNSYPITSEILNTVVNHVESSKDKPCCIIEKIPLMFIYGADSLEKFIQAFKRMSPVGYRLEEVNETYYLVLDAEAAKKLNCPFGSLEPPLGIAHKFQIVKSNPHSDDRTELKKIAEEMKDSQLFHDNDYALPQKTSDGLHDDFKSSLDSAAMFNILRDKSSRKFQQGDNDDTDTEDGNDEDHRPKSKFHRKLSVKKYDTFPNTNKQTHSATTYSDCERKRSQSERPSTAPPKLSHAETGGEIMSSSWEFFSPKRRKYSKSENVDNWSFEMQSGSPFGSSPDPLLDAKDLKPTSSVSSVNQFKPSESVGSPVMYSEVECGSFPFSNTEDGYDGDSSDTGSDLDWLSAVDTRRPVLPKFWLIMKVCNEKVFVYFHMRDRSEDDPEFIECRNILNEIISIVTNICKEVNQVLLLLSLYETRKCNRLLVPEDSDDLWKNRDLEANHSLAIDEGDSLMEVQEKYLEATLKLEPGAFDCPIVWVTHFRLHHRLTTLYPGTTKSQGMQALKSVLGAFSVINRENMFVYQEDTASVFYLRLFEEYCEEHHSGISKDDNISFLGSCSSLQSIPNKRTNESDAEEFRPRVNSGASDSYRQDSISTASSKKTQKCVALHVHGIGEVGSAITNDLTQVLQNRLNDSILDIIIGMLSRNPQCMLTPEDVQFIQNPCSPPTHEIHFTLPVKLLGYAHSLHVYLRQNMLNFLYNPKYTDSKLENHFRPYPFDPTDPKKRDEDTFLYYSKPASGHPGGKGISCIIVSLVTAQGKNYHNSTSIQPNPAAYRDGLHESEYEDLISTSLYVMKNKSPGPVALIQFHIWSVGKDSIKHLEHRLEFAVRQAIWDLIMEYRVMTAPLLEFSIFDDSGCYSEPTTPIKARRSGMVGIDTSLQMKDFYTNVTLQATKEISSSVPDITVKEFSSGPQSAKPDLHSESPKSASKSQASPKTLRGDKGNLNPMFHTMLKPFLQYGNGLGCPALNKSTHTLPSRQSVSLVAKDFLNILKTISRETPFMYYEMKRPASGSYEYIPFNPSVNLKFPDESGPGTVKNFVCIGRNEAQWKAYIGNYDFKNFQESNNEQMKNLQKYQTHTCVLKNPEPAKNAAESVPNSPTIRSGSTGVGSPQIRSPSICTPDCSLARSSNAQPYVPRQRLFLMYIRDKEVTLYLYNWPQDLTYTLVNQLTKQIAWHHQRNCLLNNIVLQKLGIFHGLTPFRIENVTIKESKPSAIKNSTDEILAPVPATIEQLIHNNSSYKEHKESHSTSSSKSSVSRSVCLMSLKNLKPKVPFHLSSSASINDPVTAHGLQYLDAVSTQRRDMQVLYNMWHSRGSNTNYSAERVFSEVKRSARLSHYCLTPILFNPSWRSRLAPIRDHTLEPLDQSLSLSEKLEPLVSNRSRHSSGSSLKNIETSGSSASSSYRSRRLSGSATASSSNQSSPKLRMKAPSEETWHSTVCRHYLQEYVQYLLTLGFVTVQTTDTTSVQSHRRTITGEEDKLSRSDSFSHRSGRGPPVFFLIKCLLGGLLVFEIGLSEPYAYGHLYSLEATRFKACSARSLNSQFIVGFLDDLDKMKLHMHLHSFTYDYHLRTIHSYISGRQLIFKHGYHLTSFLDDFIKYYQKAPTGAHNLLFAGTITISDINMPGSQLYNYIISHNKLYGMSVLRMVPVIIDSSTSIDTEFALVELTYQKASYKDFNDVFQMGNFDFGLLINQNITEITPESHVLVLNFYLILTSQRDLYPNPKILANSFGSFQTVRYGSLQSSSSYSSRKTSTVTIVPEKEKFESSGEDSTSSFEIKSKKNTMKGMCDEDVTYLGYFSSQEKMIQQVLQEQSDVAQTHLKGVVHRAAIHCRRDSLWSSLLPRSLKDENSSKEHTTPPPSFFADFSELLELVSVIPLCDIDEKLSPFMNMNLSWYLNLVPVLKSRYYDCHREYKSSDGSALYVVVTNIQCPDSFLLLSVDMHANRSDLNVVFRENPGDVERSTQEEPNLRTLALHNFIENFINVCSFHLWSSIL